MQKAYKILFVILFLALLILPAAFTNMEDGKTSESERRMLAPKAKVYHEDGSLNDNFTKDFETWISDNIGFRSQLVAFDAKIRYRFFNVLSGNTDMYLGPNNELNYASESMIRSYQHKDLYPDDYLISFAWCIKIMGDYVENNGGIFYYYQCWDKHSVYPEYFPEQVLQYGDVSKTDQMVLAIEQYAPDYIISPKQDLTEKKQTYATYDVSADPTHWSNRGAYIGYLNLMDAINKKADNKYPVLTEEDYDIQIEDQGAELFGGIHLEDYRETFTIKNRHAVETPEKLASLSTIEDHRHRFFTNDSVDNKTRILIIGDSYFNSFIIDDIAESFYETVLIWGDHLDHTKAIIDSCNADIVIIEAAERIDRTAQIMTSITNEW